MSLKTGSQQESRGTTGLPSLKAGSKQETGLRSPRFGSPKGKSDVNRILTQEETTSTRTLGPDGRSQFPQRDEFRLGLYVILAVGRDYHACRGFDPNAPELGGGHTLSSGAVSPRAQRFINIALPGTLNQQNWHGYTLNGVTYSYADSGPGKRKAEKGAGDDKVTEIQLITPDYYVGAVITAVEIKLDDLQAGWGIIADSGTPVTWVDLNFDGRQWAVQL